MLWFAVTVAALRRIVAIATEKPIDSSIPAGRALRQMLRIFPEYETGIRKEAQLEGIAKAKAKAVCEGHKPSVLKQTEKENWSGREDSRLIFDRF
ncbi:hypothetical protein [Erythrobacter sp. R86502]|uniref:hypothetical protein n=1 Tax=Erythrobacter sp. R86502 TaxID=3093846 RepID=UPI0036D2ADD2